jgi:hypothetical protein
MPRPFRRLIIALLPLLLGACVSDGASVKFDGKEHSLSLIREQKWFWDPTINLAVVATRMPECQRRHMLGPTSDAITTIAVYAQDETSFLLEQGNRLYAVETETCEKFQALKDAPAAGKGELLGEFKVVDGVFKFVDVPSPKAATTKPSSP